MYLWKILNSQDSECKYLSPIKNVTEQHIRKLINIYFNRKKLLIFYNFLICRSANSRDYTGIVIMAITTKRANPAYISLIPSRCHLQPAKL